MNIQIRNKGDKTAIIDIEGVIGVPEESQFERPDDKTATYGRFSAQLERIAALNTEKVVVNIRSTGGDVGQAILIHDALCGLGARIVTRCYGYVASAATIIAQAASPGGRELSSNSLYLIHKSSCSTEGNSAELSQALNLLDKTDGRIAGIYAARSGRDVAGFVGLMEENNGCGRWLTPVEAVEAGLADRIIRKSPLPVGAADAVVSCGLPPLPAQGDAAGLRGRLRRLLGGSDAPQPGGQPDGAGGDMERRLAASRDEMVAMVENKNRLCAMYTARIEELTDKISVLEAQNAKFRAQATQTKPKEDPSHDQRRLSANDQAYWDDVRNFR